MRKKTKAAPNAAAKATRAHLGKVKRPIDGSRITAVSMPATLATIEARASLAIMINAPTRTKITRLGPRRNKP